MVSRTTTACLIGSQTTLVTVEAEILPGFSAFHIVGLAAAGIQESKERLRAAMASLSLQWPLGRIVMNLVPADVRKSGNHWDLPLAVGLLQAMGLLDPRRVQKYAFFGELSLDGQLRGVSGAYALAEGLALQGVRRLILPEENGAECSEVAGLTLFPAKNLHSVFRFLRGQEELPSVRGQEHLEEVRPAVGDYRELQGRRALKEMMVLAAAGRHSLLLLGAPGTGKTMAVQRFPSILPDLRKEERRAIRRLASLADEPTDSRIQRPFRHVTQDITPAGLLGSAPPLRVGELSRAHAGVLFLDELLEFPRRTLEMLRTPLERREVFLSRAGMRCRLPCDVQLLACANPCPCGYYGEPFHRCTCSMGQITRYRARLSPALFDRLDLCYEMGPKGEEEHPALDTAAMRAHVEEAVARQAFRYRGEAIDFNADFRDFMDQRLLKLQPAAQRLLDDLQARDHFSDRTKQKVILIARTLADLQAVEKIGEDAVYQAFAARGTWTMQK